MSRKYINERWCARCGKSSPTPFLERLYEKNNDYFPIDSKGTVIDIGCGNGRNSQYMKDKGYTVTSVDMVNDYGMKMTLGKDPLPKGDYDIVLANYILMFLNPVERRQVFAQIQKNTSAMSVMVIEMYAAKDAFPYDWDKMVKVLRHSHWHLAVGGKDHGLFVRVK